MKTLTNRLTTEQMAELRKRLEKTADSRRQIAAGIAAGMKRSAMTDSSAVPVPQRNYNPVGANIGLATQYKCGTCGGR